MMRADDEHASSEPASQYFNFTIAEDTTTHSTFSFEILPLPIMGLTFPPRPHPPLRKRSRAAADVDGEHSCTQKKKRRLRLFLITSRLSPQFSHPATNIVDRGSSKIAVWARQKSLGRNLLRKAAILNRIRRRGGSAKEVEDGQGRVLIEQEREQEELAMAREQFQHGSVDTYTRPVVLKTDSGPPAVAARSGKRFVVSGSPSSSPTSSRSPSPTPSSPPLKGLGEPSTLDYCSPNEAYAHSPPHSHLTKRDYLPLPRSPLGLSNYDAFDLDDDIPDPYSHLDDLDDEPSTNIFGHDDDDDDDDDDLDKVPFSPSAVTPTPSSMPPASQSLDTPLQTVYSDYAILDHSEPVFGDYDGIDEGANAVWPSTFAAEAAPTIGSTSPDFTALFATAPSKRVDSFATSPNFRPRLDHDAAYTHGISPSVSRSPNFASASLPTSHSPNFTPTSRSPNFPSISPTFPPPSLSYIPSSRSSPPFPVSTPTSPNFTCVSPNFVAVDAVAAPLERRMSVPTGLRPGHVVRRSSNVEREREMELKRQRDVMFARLGG